MAGARAGSIQMTPECHEGAVNGVSNQEEPILVLTRREGTDFVLTLDSPVHLRYLRTCDTCVPTCVTLTA